MTLSTKELGIYLKNVREYLGYSTYDVNKLCKISQSYLSLMENGKRKPSAIILKKLAPIYKLDYLDLYEKAGYIDLINNSTNSKQEVPILKQINSNNNILFTKNIVGYVTIDETLNDIKNYFALKIKDDSMSPILNNDDIIIVHKQEDVENGNIAILLINDKDIIIRKISKTQNSIKLESFNPYYPEQEFTQKDIKDKNIKIIGKVVEARIKSVFK